MAFIFDSDLFGAGYDSSFELDDLEDEYGNMVEDAMEEEVEDFEDDDIWEEDDVEDDEEE